jgi:hypothetical protein
LNIEKMLIRVAGNGEALCEGGIFGNMQLHFCTSVDKCFAVEN